MISDDSIIQGKISQPKSKSNFEAYSIRIQGWVVGKNLPVKFVVICLGDKELKKVRVNQSRPSLVKSLPSVSNDHKIGFSVDLGVLGTPPKVDFEIKAKLADKSSVSFYRITIHHQPLVSNYSPSLIPILVTSLGRSGSTWMMNLLSKHPKIVVHDSHPYETLAANYWIHMLKVMTDPANHLNSAKRLGFQDNLWWVGQHPYNNRPFTKHTKLFKWFNEDYVRQFSEFSMKSIDQFYLKMANIQKQNKPTYYAEKCRPSHIPWLFRDIYHEIREIFLVRDFRDTITSMLAFNKKRGYVGVGPRKASSDVEFIQLLRPRIQSLLEAYDQRKANSYYLRYEDLVRNPEQSLSEVLDYLQLENNRKIINEMTNGRSQRIDLGKIKNHVLERNNKLLAHQTKGNPIASIGRWKQDLSEELQFVCKEELGDLLELAGYSDW